MSDQWRICGRLLSGGHCLIAGTTGSGKSVFCNSLLWSLMAAPPEERSFFAVDLKRVELSRYKKARHCIQLATEPETALQVLARVNRTVDKRFQIMQRRGLVNYPGGTCYLFIDELAELIAADKKTVVADLSRIMRLGRAARVVVFGFTQNPSRGGGLRPEIVQNFTQAVALRCRSAIESRQIIGIPGAENLPRYGSGLLWDSDGVQLIEIPKTPDADLQARIRQNKKRFTFF